MSSPPQDEALLDAWLKGTLPEDQARELEASLSLDEDFLDDFKKVTTGFEGVSPLNADPRVTGLVDLVKSRGTVTPSSTSPDGAAQQHRWKEFVEPASEEEPHLIGRLGSYELLEVIAIGGMGVVFKARDSDLKRISAVKMIAPGLIGNPNACERFLREARAAARLDHENILPIYGVFHEPIPHFAMKFAGGGTLEGSVSESSPLEFEKLKSVAAQIAAALQAAHENGFIHRDIKPANVLFDESGEDLWVCDFGIARSLEDPALTYAGVITGTPQFMSPEQAAGEELDFRSDLFSLGAVLYFAATGKPPFDGRTTVSVLQSVADSSSVSLRDSRFPQWFRRLLENLLSHRKEDRPASAREVLTLIEQETSPETIREKQNRRRFIATAGAFGFAGVAGIGAWQIPGVRSKLKSISGAGSTVPPRIFILNTGEEFPSIGDALKVVSDGDTLVLEGRIICDREFLTPENIALKVTAGRGGATLIAGHTGHALFFKGNVTIENIHFIRLGWTDPVRPLLGVAPRTDHEKPGAGRIVNCHFESLPPSPDVHGGDGVAITDCPFTEVIDCTFNLPTGTGILLVSDLIGTGEMKVEMKNSSFNTDHAFYRRNFHPAYHRIIMQHCVIVSNFLVADSHRNPFYTFHVGFFDSVYDCRRGYYLEPYFIEEDFQEAIGWKSQLSALRGNVPFVATNEQEKLSHPFGPLKEIVGSFEAFEKYVSPKFTSNLDQVFDDPFDRAGWENSGRKFEDLKKFATPELKDFAPDALKSLDNIPT